MVQFIKIQSSEQIEAKPAPAPVPTPAPQRSPVHSPPAPTTPSHAPISKPAATQPKPSPVPEPEPEPEPDSEPEPATHANGGDGVGGADSIMTGAVTEGAHNEDIANMAGTHALDEIQFANLSRNALIGLCRANGIKFNYNDRKSELLEKLDAVA